MSVMRASSANVTPQTIPIIQMDVSLRNAQFTKSGTSLICNDIVFFLNEPITSTKFIVFKVIEYT